MEDLILPPVPVQKELIEIPGSVALLELQAAFKNDFCNVPEKNLRYLIYLILSDSDADQIKHFCLQVRIDLNQQRLEKLRESANNLVPLGN